MVKRFGVKFNSQRDSVRKILAKSKMTEENEKLFNDRDWLHKEYVENEKTLTEIGRDRNVYYGTVGEYCRKYGFEIRQRSNYSIEEKEICEFIKSLGLDLIHGDRESLDTKEIDVYIPSHKFGIELNGLYWHSFNPYSKNTPKIENKNKHRDKAELAKSAGVNLIQITDYEWNHKNDIVKSIIKTKLNKIDNKIYARKCEIKLVPLDEQRDFLNKNHLQEYVAAPTAMGLYYENELVMIMTIGNPRYSKTADVELFRLCSKINTSVIGGTKRLFKRVRELCKDMEIVSYCNMSIFDGGCYESLGFQLQSCDISYFWTDGNIKLSRDKVKVENLAKWLMTYDPNKSADANLFDAKYRRYWNSGIATWIQKL